MAGTPQISELENWGSIGYLTDKDWAPPVLSQLGVYTVSDRQLEYGIKKKYLIKYLKKKINKFLDGFFVQLEFSRSADRIWGFSTFDLHNVMEDDIFVCNLPSICAPDFYGARNDGMALLKDTHLQ